MIEAAHFALVLGLAVSFVQAALPAMGWARGDATLMRLAAPVSIGTFALVLFAFSGLTAAYVTSDFSVENVFRNSHSQQPLIYRFTSTWGNHEGSMLLWILILTLFGASIALFGRHLPLRLKALTIAVQGSISLAFIAFVLFTSNPFRRIAPAPGEGEDLNPILQDLGLAIHPPLLYVGYVGFSITFAFAVAALIEGRVDSAWARWVRPWTLAAWVFLTLGIAMGSYWAYYELGWGGWWFWDPVENASLLPWLSGTALLHSAIVVEKRMALRTWTVLLALLTFALSLLGTFLVRSGVLTSVHTFATDPQRGLAILLILVLFVGGSFTLFAWRARALEGGGLFAPVSRETALVLNNFLLTTSAATVLVGTLYPLGYEAITGDKLSVGPPYYVITVVPILALICLAVPFGPFLPWKRGELRGTAQRLAAAALTAFAVGFAIFLLRGGTLAPLGIALGVFVAAGSFADPLWRAKLGRASLDETIRRLRNTPRAVWGGTLAHAGVGVVVIGVTASTAWQTETVEVMKPGDTIETSIGAVRFGGLQRVDGPNWFEQRARLDVLTADGARFVLSPSKRIYPARETPTTEASIETRWFSQAYASLGDIREDGSAVVRIYEKPFVTLIWLGALVMALGGSLSLLDRRLRIGVPGPKRKVVAA